MKTKILIMGLPGAGKTYFAERLKTYIEDNSIISLSSMINDESPYSSTKAKVNWFNADEIRKKYNDWDFSKDGRIRQSLRMAEFALNSDADYIICDFIAPLPEMRTNFNADWTIWIDTIELGRFEDTNKIFSPPNEYDFRITEQNAEKWVKFVGDHILNNIRRPVFDWKKDTVQMLGRWQPWHKGHRALFERLLEKTGQVIIQVRDTPRSENNPFDFNDVVNFIKRDLDLLYQGKYEIMLVPNIVHIGWGRNVGYTANEEQFDDSVTQISATKIREQFKKI